MTDDASTATTPEDIASAYFIEAADEFAAEGSWEVYDDTLTTDAFDGYMEGGWSDATAELTKRLADAGLDIDSLDIQALMMAALYDGRARVRELAAARQ